MTKRIKHLDVKKTCENCKNQFTVKWKLRKHRFCCWECSKEYLRGSNHPCYGKTGVTKKTHPEWAAQISKTCKEKGINVGDKNAMKRPEVAKKAGLKVVMDVCIRKTHQRLLGGK